jgi:hypothetical protein
MHLLFVADGERDHAVLPPLIERVLDCKVQPTFFAWKSDDLRLNRGRGYQRKLELALRKARDANLEGVVATIDADAARPKERLSELRAGREKDRQNTLLTPLPAALGEAVPHVEAWLLDD